MNQFLCIHGHFYQPPRENPWLEAVEMQDSAFPYHDWNERVAADCYIPNAHARILDGEGFITAIRNNYSHISFNFGPTLLSWIEQFEPALYAALQAADAESVARCGHGSAMAQAYNHMILPLANPRDVATQVAWGIRDFEHRFGRRPEGMWLPETAANLASFEALAEAGIEFTILAPRQAHRVRPLGGGEWREVGANIDPRQPYQAALPSGRKLAVFFYDGPLARAVAFEGLLDDGARFASRLMGGFNGEDAGNQLVHIATDGESYGHHHRFGEMALAYALEALAGGGDAQVTNYGAYLAANPPRHEVEIWENSSWSCVHGVERWKSDCGCNSGGHPGWNQKWRAPLREAMDWLRDQLAPQFEAEGGQLLRDPWAARNDYIGVVLERSTLPEFLRRHARRELKPEEVIRALELLEAQRHAMLMYTSCGWFFDEISGIETVQDLQYAGRALQLAQKLPGGAADLEGGFLQRLEQAPSNLAGYGNGRGVFDALVRPAEVALPQVGAHYAVSSLFEDYGEEAQIYGFTVRREAGGVRLSGRMRFAIGRIQVCSRITLECETFSYSVFHLGDHNLSGGVRPYQGEAGYQAMCESLEHAFDRADVAALLHGMEENFGPSWNPAAGTEPRGAAPRGGGTYSLRLLFRDEQRRVLDRVLETSLRQAESVYREFYEQQAPLLRFLHDLKIPAPRHLIATAEEALRLQILQAVQAVPLERERLRLLAEEARASGLDLRRSAQLGMSMSRTLERLARAWQAQPEALEPLQELERTASLVHDLPFDTQLGPAQDIFFDLLPTYWAKLPQAGEPTANWLESFRRLGEALRMRIPAAPGVKDAIASPA